MKINFKKLSDTAIAPTKGHYNDAGFDLYADEDATLTYGETRAINTNIALELPDGYMADVRPRSGLTRDTALRVQYGTVDAGYRGGIGIICENANYGEDVYYTEKLFGVANAKSDIDFSVKANEAVTKWNSMAYHIHRGDKIAQLVIQKIPDIELIEADELNETARGAGGFGSTGV